MKRDTTGDAGPDRARYRAADLPRILHLPLEELARGGKAMREADLRLKVGTAEHEAAHLVAACHCRAYVYAVKINKPKQAGRTGPLGSVHSVEVLPEETAFIALVGFAWEERHGDLVTAREDLRAGQEYAAEAGESVDVLLNEARQFVVVTEELIRDTAAGILATLPRSGVLKGRKLHGLLEWVRSLDRAHARAAVNGRLAGKSPCRRPASG